MKLKDKFIAKTDELAYRIIEGRAVVVSLDTTVLHSDKINIFSKVATRIWQHIDGKNRVKDIVGLICKEFDVNRKLAEKQIEDFIYKLKKKNLVVISDEPIIKK